MRVLFAPKEVAGQVSILSHALRGLGVLAMSLSFSEHPFEYPIDKVIILSKYPDFLQKVIRVVVFLFALILFDIFHFQAGKTFARSNRDLPILKFFGKKVVMHLHGSEIRDSSGIARRNFSFLKKNIDKFITAPSELLDLVPDAAPLPISVEKGWFVPRKHVQNHDEFVVVHAPSSRTIKGTKYLIDACVNLKKKGYPLKLILVENTPHREVRKFYEQADVFVDQLLIGWYGTASVENMAMGNPVVVYVRPDLRRRYCPDLPAIQATKDSIQEVLESLMRDRRKLNKIVFESRKYALKYHHPIRNAKKLIKIYQSL